MKLWSAPLLTRAALAQNLTRLIEAVPTQNGHLNIADFLIINKDFFDLLQDNPLRPARSLTSA